MVALTSDRQFRQPLLPPTRGYLSIAGAARLCYENPGYFGAMLKIVNANPSSKTRPIPGQYRLVLLELGSRGVVSNTSTQSLKLPAVVLICNPMARCSARSWATLPA